jgi:hypothetical protein
MSERVEAVGGELSYGPMPGRGWAVRAVLPTRNAVEPRPIETSRGSENVTEAQRVEGAPGTRATGATEHHRCLGKTGETGETGASGKIPDLATETGDGQPTKTTRTVRDVDQAGEAEGSA